ncbi:AI-2E family transporter [Ferruginibacter sp.]|uniref:AI-2E family transporter n=1 Tax=Ferruginibacter sp. TaxID=1940288 RepID=UPI0019898A87|nr:AI-2E family transporter [Ferruginibacter sp.]MBC7628646.1 AI-2E family transporter [Ferruginibacter sp.]
MPEINTGQPQDKLSYSKKVWITAGIAALLVIFLLLFKVLFSVLLLTLAGVLFAIYFHGCASFFKKCLHLPATWSLALSIVVNIVFLIVFFWFVGARLQQQVSDLTDALPKTIANAKAYLQKSPIGSRVLDYLKSSGNSQKTMAIAKKFFSSGFGILSDVYIILLLGMFFIASPFTYKKGIVHLLPPKAKDQGAELLDEIHNVLKNWIKGQLFGFLFIAVLTGLGLWAIGMPLILTLALIAGLLNFVPNFGPIIALIPAGLIGLMQGTTTAILVLCLYTIIQAVQTGVTQPLIQQKMVSIPPALIIFGQVSMGLLGGFWGVLLATPVIAIIMTLVNKLYVEKQSQHKYEFKNANA